MKPHGHSKAESIELRDEQHNRFLALGEVARYTYQLEAIEAERHIAIGRAVEFGANSNQLAQATKTTPGKMKRDYPNCVKRRKE